MSEELKPCFCGAKAILTVHRQDYREISTVCGHIVDFDEANAGSENIEAVWNTRAEPPELADLRDEVARLNKIIESVSGLERCNFDVESEADCNFCDNPSGAVFASVSYLETPEANFYACEKCVPARIRWQCEATSNDELRDEVALLKAERENAVVQIQEKRKTYQRFFDADITDDAARGVVMALDFALYQLSQPLPPPPEDTK